MAGVFGITARSGFICSGFFFFFYAYGGGKSMEHFFWCCVYILDPLFFLVSFFLTWLAGCI